jgi:hypothetical protein
MKAPRIFFLYILKNSPKNSAIFFRISKRTNQFTCVPVTRLDKYCLKRFARYRRPEVSTLTSIRGRGTERIQRPSNIAAAFNSRCGTISGTNELTIRFRSDCRPNGNTNTVAATAAARPRLGASRKPGCNARRSLVEIRINECDP